MPAVSPGCKDDRKDRHIDRRVDGRKDGQDGRKDGRKEACKDDLAGAPAARGHEGLDRSISPASRCEFTALAVSNLTGS
jgi:hypothetical protein